MKLRAALVVLALSRAALAKQEADGPETVVVTYRPLAGKEAEVAALIAKHYATIERLGLVTKDAHITYRDKDDKDRPIFVDVLTWVTHAAPDNAPAEVQAIWKQMNAATEKRGASPRISIHEVERVP